MTFSLIVTHEPGLDNYRWVRNQLRQITGGKLRYVSSYQSVVLYDVDEDPHEVAAQIRRALKGVGTPIIRVIPVDYVAEPEIDEVCEVVKEFIAPKVPEGVKFRVTLEGHLLGRGEDGRLRRLHTIDSVRRVAALIDRPVDLENPDVILFIKVVRYMRWRRKAAVSLLKPEELERVSP